MYHTVLGISILSIVHYSDAKILFDGRIPKETQPSAFDLGSTPYNNKFVHGQNQTWSGIIQTSNLPSSSNDGTTFQAFDLSLTDASIFVPNPSTIQTGFRRSELLPKPEFKNLLTSGVTTFHFSLMKDPKRPLNLTHEYQLVFIEPDDGTHVFEIKYGTAYQNTATPVAVNPHTADTLRLMSSSTAGWDQMKVLFQTDFTPGLFHNFAITIDWTNATLTARYSKGNYPLKVVVPTISNAVKPGEFHIGMVKLPVGLTKSVVFDGYQESHIHESLIYGGVMVDTA